MGAEREKRVEEFRETSRKADELADKGRLDETVALLTGGHAAAPSVARVWPAVERHMVRHE